MDLLSEIYERIAALVDGRLALTDLRDWIADASETADDRGLEAARVLSGRVWRHISEHGYGHLNDEALRAELAALIEARMQAPTVSSGLRIEHAFAAAAPGEETDNPRRTLSGVLIPA
jgi:hypothetical protein